MRPVVFEANMRQARVIPTRRPGEPREQWIVATMSDAFDCGMHTDAVRYEEDNEKHLETLLEAAGKREGSFEMKPRK